MEGLFPYGPVACMQWKKVVLECATCPATHACLAARQGGPACSGIKKRSGFGLQWTLSPIPRHTALSSLGMAGLGNPPKGTRLLWVCCGKPRLGRSTQGADIRLPGPASAWVTERGRCTRFRQCRQARDTDPSLPEPSRRINHSKGIKSTVFFSPPWKGGAGGGCGPHVLSSEPAASIHPRPSLRKRGEGVAPHQHPSWQVGGPREAGRDGNWGERGVAEH
jgi:hypothetical protein